MVWVKCYSRNFPSFFFFFFANTQMTNHNSHKQLLQALASQLFRDSQGNLLIMHNVCCPFLKNRGNRRRKKTFEVQLVSLSGQLSCFISRVFNRVLKAEGNKHLRAHVRLSAVIYCLESWFQVCTTKKRASSALYLFQTFNKGLYFFIYLFV